LSSYKEPLNIVENVRCDSGIEEGSEISLYYDPMICKLVTYGPDRQSALNTMSRALDNYVIRGVTNNISLLRDIVTEDNFVKGDISTAYLTKIYPEGFKGKTLNAQQKNNLIALAAIVYSKEILRSREFLNSASMLGSKPNKTFEFVVVENEQNHSVRITKRDDSFELNINGNTDIKINDSFNLSDEIININLNGQTDDQLTMQLISKESNGAISLQYLGTKFKLQVYTKNSFDKLKYMKPKPKIDLSSQILSPMPGIVKSIAVTVGQKVLEGHEICTVEAMKMQNKLNASKTGIVINI